MINHQTIKKANEIKELIKLNYSLRDILQKKFNRSRAKLEEHINIAKELYTKEELNILLTKEKNNITQFIKKDVEIYPGNEIINFEELKALKELISHKNELLDLIKTNNKSIKNHLIISDNVSELKDNRITSVRISQELEREFNDICRNYKSLSKTIILNQAIYEFIEKYK